MTIAVRQDLYLLQHPFYRAWMKGQLSEPMLRDYARQYYHHVEAFPSYLMNTMELCEDEDSRQVLKENLAEEDGSIFGTPHPELWLRFAEGMGSTREEVKTSPQGMGIRNVIDTFSKLSKASRAEALGSLYAYESQVPEIAHSKIEGLKQNYGVTDERTLEFFEVHKNADVTHRESLFKLLNQLPSGERGRAQVAADKAAQSLWDFLTEVYSESHCA